MRKLLKGTARLEFRTGTDAQDFTTFRNQAIEYYTVEPDTTDSLQTDISTNPLIDVLGFVQGQTPYVFGYALADDTAKVMELLANEDIQRMMPRNTEVLWGSNPVEFADGTKQFTLYGVNTNVELTGEVIEEASIQFDPVSNAPEVAMGMNSDGARTWSRITGANIGKPVAIVLDGYIVSYPNVQTKISGGNSTISGLESVEEAEDLVNILLSGALPAPLNILEERTVGATLGLFLLVLVSICMYWTIYCSTVYDILLHERRWSSCISTYFKYHSGCSCKFWSCTHASRYGWYCTYYWYGGRCKRGIFDRIREEQRGGKTMKAAISAGYSNAWSAIFDANVTTGFVALILLSFGVGPIKVCCNTLGGNLLFRF